MTEEDGRESSNICFFEYSFSKSLKKAENESYKIGREEGLRLFQNLFDYRKPIKYMPRTQPWLWCITHYQKIMMDNKAYLFAIFNRMRPIKIEKVFDLKKYEEKETEIQNVIEHQWKFVVIPDLRLIATEYTEHLSSDLFKIIFYEIWIKSNGKEPMIKLIEKKEKWTYDKVIREFDNIRELAFRNMPYPNPIVGSSIEEAKEWFKRLRIEILDNLKMKGQEEGINAEDIFLASLARVAERKKGVYEGIGLIKGKLRSFHSGISKITTNIKYKHEDIGDFIKNVVESIENLFFRRL